MMKSLIYLIIYDLSITGTDLSVGADTALNEITFTCDRWNKSCNHLTCRGSCIKIGILFWTKHCKGLRSLLSVTLCMLCQLHYCHD